MMVGGLCSVVVEGLQTGAAKERRGAVRSNHWVKSMGRVTNVMAVLLSLLPC